MAASLNNEQSSEASDGEESMNNVMSVMSESRNESKSNADDSEDEQDLKKRLEELQKKRPKKEKGKPPPAVPKKLVSKEVKKAAPKATTVPVKPKAVNKLDKSPQPKLKEPPKAKEKPTVKDEKMAIDKSKLRYSQTNLLKQKSKSTLYDKRAEESISNILNRKTPSPGPPTKTASFTQKSYLDKSAALIEADQTLQIKDQKPVTSGRISPEKMTNSLRTIVKHLYRNKKSIDISQMNKQEAKSTVKFTLNSFIDEDGTRGD